MTLSASVWRRRSSCWPRDGEVAGGADFHFSDIPVRGDDGARAIGANDDAALLWSNGIDADNTPDRKPR